MISVLVIISIQFAFFNRQHWIPDKQLAESGCIFNRVYLFLPAAGFVVLPNGITRFITQLIKPP
jgi:hypothetical protein